MIRSALAFWPHVILGLGNLWETAGYQVLCDTQSPCGPPARRLGSVRDRLATVWGYP